MFSSFTKKDNTEQNNDTFSRAQTQLDEAIKEISENLQDRKDFDPALLKLLFYLREAQLTTNWKLEQIQKNQTDLMNTMKKIGSSLRSMPKKEL
tara:strand:+ start:305 stop:586 length:282 start_codon:yes stop_codon:yes gene_type:complete